MCSGARSERRSFTFVWEAPSPIEVTCTGYRKNSDAETRTISKALETHVRDRNVDTPLSFVDPRGHDVLQSVIKPIFYEGEEQGVIVIGSRLS
jgi:hypothetical protein